MLICLMSYSIIKIPRERESCVLCSLLYLRGLAQCLEYTKFSINKAIRVCTLKLDRHEFEPWLHLTLQVTETH